MPKQLRSARSLFIAQLACLLVLFVWSVVHVPAETGKAIRPAGPTVTTGSHESANGVIDNSDDTASADGESAANARFVAPPTIHFRTEHPPAGTFNLRPLELESTPDKSDRWDPVQPQNPPQRVPTGPRSPYETNAATVYYQPLGR